MNNSASEGLLWFKSSHSGSEGDSCIEVAVGPGTVHVRDSKDVEGPRFAVLPAAWSCFVGFAADS